VIAILDVACDRLELSDPAGAARLRREADTTAGEPPHPYTIWHRRVYDTGLALMEGRLAEVEGRVEEALELGRRIEHPYARGCANAHLAELHSSLDAHEQVLAAFDPVIDARQGPIDWVRTRVARSRLALGRRSEALSLYEPVVAEGPGSIRRNLRWMATMVEIAHCCADLEDSERASAWIDALLPFEAHHGVMPMVICYGGPVPWALARLHEIRGRADDADDLYREALASATEMGARPVEARIRLGHGRLLRRRRQRGAAREQLSAAAALAADLGIVSIEEAACREMDS
jgi:tetratricopeptide (TPR) repeat protein